MAVTFVRSALMVPGKFPQAQEYLEKRIKWLKETFGLEVSLMVGFGGQVGRSKATRWPSDRRGCCQVFCLSLP